MVRLSSLLFVILLVVLCAGCSRDRGLRGKWVLDREFTEAHLKDATPAASPAKGSSLLGSLQEMGTAMLAPMLLAQLDGMTITITDKEVRSVSKSGTGEALSYEIVERPTAQSWRVKTSDGKIATFERQGERLMTTTAGSAQFPIYLKRADP